MADENTASEITQSIAVILGSYVDAVAKFTAFESALKEHNPAFYAQYLNRLEKGESLDRQRQLIATALARLQEILQK